MVRKLEAALPHVRMDMGSSVGSKKWPPRSCVTDPFFPALITCVKHIYGLCLCSPGSWQPSHHYAPKQKRSCRCANCLVCHRPSLTFDDVPMTGLHTMITNPFDFCLKWVLNTSRYHGSEHIPRYCREGIAENWNKSRTSNPSVTWKNTIANWTNQNPITNQIELHKLLCVC